MTQQNTMPDVIYMDEDGIYESGMNPRLKTKYIRADAVEDEMAPVKGQIVKLNCKISDMEIILKRARDALDGLLYCYVSNEDWAKQCVNYPLHEKSRNTITAIDKVLGEQNAS